MDPMEVEDASRLNACERCHRRKARCDKAQPSCSSCTKADAPCIYSPREPLLRREDNAKLQRRIRQLEAKSEALTRQLREANGRANSSTSNVYGQETNGEDCSNSEPNSLNNRSNNEVANQVSVLSLNAGGEQQFLGSASGLLLGKLLQVEGHTHTTAGREDDICLASRRFGSGFGIKAGTLTPKAITLPSEKLARSLLSAYLSHDHLCFPFISPRYLTDAIDSIYAEDCFYGSHPVEAFTTDMIFAIGTAQVYKFDWQVLPDAETHYDRATSRLSTVLDRGGIVALQAILLMCQYRMLSAAYDTSASLWHLIGMAARICFELGLHRESVYTVPDSASPESMDASKRNSEIKRRCFWCVAAMDRVASITLGRPLAINLDDVDAELPFVAANTGSTPDGPFSPNESYESPHWMSRTAIFKHIVRYRLICGKVLTSLHNAVKRKPYLDYAAIRQDLALELDTWYQETNSLALVDTTSPTEQDRSSFRSRDWYNLLYQNGVLMLYRPSSTLPDLPQNNDILQRIYDASQQSITVYGYLHRSRKINYSWITLHAVFIAGLSYIYAVRVHFQTRRRQLKPSRDVMESEIGAHLPSDPTINQIVRNTRACLTVLVAVSERWSTSRNSHIVFGRLSDALLADAVEYYTQPVLGGQAPDPSAVFGYNEPVSGHSISGSTTTGSQNYGYGAYADVANSYQNCFDDMQQLWGGHFGDQTFMQASQEWLSEIQALDGSFIV